VKTKEINERQLETLKEQKAFLFTNQSKGDLTRSHRIRWAIKNRRDMNPNLDLGR
jgi:hypothetical protein